MARKGLGCLVLAGLVAAPLPGTPAAAQDAGDIAVTADLRARYADAKRWLCLPDRDDDPCGKDQRAVEVRADGSTVPYPWPAKNDDTGTDCFYVYPTVNLGPIPANPEPWPGEPAIGTIATAQAAPFRGTCRVFAPYYRQATIGIYALPDRTRRKFIDVAARDVIAAFDQYLATYNRGRRIVLIGHSQGGEMLIRLIQARFDPSEQLRARLSLAILSGIPVHVPLNADVGGDFSRTPVCTRTLQRGCVISFASYVDGANPKDDSRMPTPAGQERVCVNPATLDLAALDPQGKRTARGSLRGSLHTPSPFTLGFGPYRLVRDAYSAACARSTNTGDMRFLSIRSEMAPGDRRSGIVQLKPSPLAPLIDAILGDIGLHAHDMEFAMNDLIALAEARNAP